MALGSASTFSASVMRTASGGEGLLNECCRRTSRWHRDGHLCSQCSSVCGSSVYSGHVGSAAGSSNWCNALRSEVCPDCRRARTTASALLGVQSAFQEKCSYTMAVGGLLDGGSVMVRRMRAIVVVNEIGRGDVSVAATFANSSAASLPGMPSRPGNQIRVVGPSLFSVPRVPQTCPRVVYLPSLWSAHRVRGGTNSYTAVEG